MFLLSFCPADKMSGYFIMEELPSIPSLLEKYYPYLKFILSGLLLFGSGLLLARVWEYRRRPKLSYQEDAVPEVKQAGLERSSQITQSVEIKVDVSGSVNKPGVYSLQTGDRVEDALKKAGGIADNADKEWVSKELNLAAKVSDGTKLYVPAEGESAAGEVLFRNETAGRVAGVANDSSDSSAGCPSKININTAPVETLTCLYNVGEKRAQAIIDYRAQKPFESVEELTNIRGIGEKTLERVRDKITLQ